MRRSTLAVLILLGSAAPAVAQTGPSTPVIVTQGEAVLKRAPDRAWIGIATETRDVKAADARRKSAEFMTAVQKTLKDAGVAAEAVRTTGYSLAPDVERIAGHSTMKGYVVRNQIEVRVDDLDKLGDVLDAANGAKGSTLSITGPRFDLKNADAVHGDALRQAVESAMSRAQAIAAGARRSLGAIVRVEEQNMGPVFFSPALMQGRVGGGGQDNTQVETPITPGEIEIRALVTLTVEIR